MGTNKFQLGACTWLGSHSVEPVAHWSKKGDYSQIKALAARNVLFRIRESDEKGDDEECGSLDNDKLSNSAYPINASIGTELHTLLSHLQPYLKKIIPISS